MKNNSRRILRILLTAAVLIAAMTAARELGFASTRSGMRIAYAGTETRTVWIGRYALLDGTFEKSLYPDGTLSITVETDGGTIAMKITDQDGNVLYQREDMETGSFNVEASGRVTVRIEAARHKGSFVLEAAP